MEVVKSISQVGTVPPPYLTTPQMEQVGHQVLSDASFALACFGGFTFLVLAFGFAGMGQARLAVGIPPSFFPERLYVSPDVATLPCHGTLVWITPHGISTAKFSRGKT